MMDLGFEDGDEASFAETEAVFGTDDYGAVYLALSARRWHFWRRTSPE